MAMMQGSEVVAADHAAQLVLRLVPRLHRWAQTRALQGEVNSDLSLRQLSALAIIREESTTLGEIARRLRVTPAVITGLIDRLEKRGYVRRVTEPGDRRRIYLEPTEAGRQVGLAVEHRLIEEVSVHLSRLPADELASIERGLSSLERVLAELEATHDERSG